MLLGSPRHHPELTDKVNQLVHSDTREPPSIFKGTSGSSRVVSGVQSDPEGSSMFSRRTVRDETLSASSALNQLKNVIDQFGVTAWHCLLCET